MQFKLFLPLCKTLTKHSARQEHTSARDASPTSRARSTWGASFDPQAHTRSRDRAKVGDACLISDCCFFSASSTVIIFLEWLQLFLLVFTTVLFANNNNNILILVLYVIFAVFVLNQPYLQVTGPQRTLLSAYVRALAIPVAPSISAYSCFLCFVIIPVGFISF